MKRVKIFKFKNNISEDNISEEKIQEKIDEWFLKTTPKITIDNATSCISMDKYGGFIIIVTIIYYN